MKAFSSTTKTRIIALHNRGLSTSDISDCLKIPEQSIENYLGQLFNGLDFKTLNKVEVCLNFNAKDRENSMRQGWLPVEYKGKPAMTNGTTLFIHKPISQIIKSRKNEKPTV